MSTDLNLFQPHHCRQSLFIRAAGGLRRVGESGCAVVGCPLGHHRQQVVHGSISSIVKTASQA
jgi:hypothetical protein